MPVVLTKEQRIMFIKNIRFLYEQTPLKNMSQKKAIEEWENNFGTSKQGFPLGKSSNYSLIFRGDIEEASEIKLPTILKVIQVINPYLQNPYDFKPNGEGIMDFVSYEFNSDNQPALKKSIFGSFEKYLQKYYIYACTDKKTTLSLGTLSIHETTMGVKAVMLSHFRNMSEIYNKQKVWGIFKDVNDEEKVQSEYRKTYGGDNNNQPICKLFFADVGDVKFNSKYLTINFHGEEGESFLYLDISNTAKRENLHYQFGCGTLVTHMNNEIPTFECAHVMLVTAEDEPGGCGKEKNDQEDETEGSYIDKLLDPLPCDIILGAVDYCELKFMSADFNKTEDFYQYTKMHNIEKARTKRRKNDLSKEELGDLIKKLESIYEKM